MVALNNNTYSIMNNVRDIYGGAGQCRIPLGWIDASTLRQVPDHQEVFVNQGADQSIIIEILQYEGAVSNQDAGKYFFDDLGMADNAEDSVIENVTISEKVLFGERIVRIDTKGVQVKAKSGPSAIAAPVSVYMTLFRAPKLHSDILLTSHSLTGGLDDVHNSIVESFNIVDSGLFH